MAPGPQTWRFLTPGINDKSCTTQVLTLRVEEVSERWKLRTDDELEIERGVRLGSVRAGEGDVREYWRKVMSVDDRIKVEELGDDLAVEGLLRITHS